jgi:hypothetical protein
MRGNTQPNPSSQAERPILMNEAANVADEAAIRMSHPNATPKPAPAAAPLRDAGDRAVRNGDLDPAQRRTDTAAGDVLVHVD